MKTRGWKSRAGKRACANVRQERRVWFSRTGGLSITTRNTFLLTWLLCHSNVLISFFFLSFLIFSSSSSDPFVTITALLKASISRSDYYGIIYDRHVDEIQELWARGFLLIGSTRTNYFNDDLIAFDFLRLLFSWFNVRYTVISWSKLYFGHYVYYIEG